MENGKRQNIWAEAGSGHVFISAVVGKPQLMPVSQSFVTCLLLGVGEQHGDVLSVNQNILCSSVTDETLVFVICVVNHLNCKQYVGK